MPNNKFYENIMNEKMLVDPEGEFPSDKLSKVEENALSLLKLLDVKSYERTKKLFKLYVNNKVLLVTGKNLYFLSRDIDLCEMKNNLAVRAKTIDFEVLNKLNDREKVERVKELLNNL